MSPVAWVGIGIVVGIVLDGLVFDWPFRRRAPASRVGDDTEDGT